MSKQKRVDTIMLTPGKIALGKIGLAALIGAFCGAILCAGVQPVLYEQMHKTGCLMARSVLLSEQVSVWLGVLTASGLVLQKIYSSKVLGSLYVLGSLLCIHWLTTARESYFHEQWILFIYRHHPQVEQYQQSFTEFVAEVIVNHGVPVLWAGALFYGGLKLLYRSREEAQQALSNTSLQKCALALVSFVFGCIVIGVAVENGIYCTLRFLTSPIIRIEARQNPKYAQ